MRLFAVINQKGGVGKTTTVTNLAYNLAERGNKVTVVDIDPQGQLAASFGLNVRQTVGIDEILLEDAPIKDLVLQVNENLSLVPAGKHLSDVEHLTEGSAERARRLKQALEKLHNQDFVFLDCPPSSGFMVASALYSTREVLIPVASEYLSLHGLSHLMGTIKHFEKSLGYKFKQWVVVTRYHRRRRLSQDVYKILQEHFPGKVLATPIRETTALAESPSFGKTIFQYSKNSHGAEDYQSLASDLLKGRTL